MLMDMSEPLSLPFFLLLLPDLGGIDRDMERSSSIIGMDMDAHLLKSDDLAEFASRPQAKALLLTALAEIHANAHMFGGLQSTSFKIKWKHLDKRGRQVLDLIG